jgi:poly(glycerol-phosphate) alpha-glucosyltransferase
MLPEGRYLSCAFAVSPDAGGQTRALLLRNRILAARGGVRPTLLTFNAAPD